MEKIKNIKNSINNNVKELKNFDYKNINIEETGSWPSLIQYIFFVIIFCFIVYMGNVFLIQKDLKTLKTEAVKEKQLLETIRADAYVIPTHEEYVSQLFTLNKNLEMMQAKLPEKIEMSSILDEMNTLALKNNIILSIIVLKNENEKENYVELPFQIESKGKFHNFINFLSDLSKMNRIVTVHNIAFQNDEKINMLKMELIAKTYRYGHSKTNSAEEGGSNNE